MTLTVRILGRELFVIEWTPAPAEVLFDGRDGATVDA